MPSEALLARPFVELADTLVDDFDVATIAILQHRAAIEAHLVVDQLNHALNSRVAIEQAKGILAERVGLDMEGAFSWLRNHARSHNLLLVDVAQSIIEGKLVPEPPLAGPSSKS